MSMLGTALIEPLLLYDLEDELQFRAEIVDAEIVRSDADGFIRFVRFVDVHLE